MQTIPNTTNSSLYIVVLASPVLWLMRVAILMFFAVLGVPLIAVFVLFRIYQARTVAPFNRTLPEFPRWAGLWNNTEDGVDGLRGGDPAQFWWRDQTAGWSQGKRIFRWSAFRNPVDSLRWLPVINPKLDPSRVRFVGMDHEPDNGESGWYFAWLSGTAYSCIRFEYFGFRFWLGTKIHPEDRNGLQPDDYRAIRCDFAAQFKRVQ